MSKLLYLKLGGSLITDKTQPYIPRLDRIADLCTQIAQFQKEQRTGSREQIQLLLGHGSGSFGHTAAREYGTRQGVRDEAGWAGFAEVHYQAATLNRILMEALHRAGAPALAFPPSACVVARRGKVAGWEISPIRRALSANMIPVIYGDVVFDEQLGGTILSTEDLFKHLAHELPPTRILLAGLEPGVWMNFSARSARSARERSERIIDKITPDSYHSVQGGVGQAMGADVTGGMQSKVEEMLELVQVIPGLQVMIFSGQEPGSVLRALHGEHLGTQLSL